MYWRRLYVEKCEYRLTCMFSACRCGEGSGRVQDLIFATDSQREVRYALAFVQWKSVDGPAKYKFRELKCATIDELRYLLLLCQPAPASWSQQWILCHPSTWLFVLGLRQNVTGILLNAWHLGSGWVALSACIGSELPQQPTRNMKERNSTANNAAAYVDVGNSIV